MNYLKLKGDKMLEDKKAVVLQETMDILDRLRLP